jgi:AraC-like DNA-binding protein
MSAKRSRCKPASSPPSPHKGKPGPLPFVPTTRQRREVELAMATGMSLETIADAMEVSRRTLCRSFARELAVGRSKKLLASVVRLDDLAAAGNVSAAKYLHGLMLNHGNKPESFEDDKWATIASQIEADLDEQGNLPKKGEFWKNN